MRLIYMAHPVSGDVARNLKNARAWLQHLTETRDEPTAIIAPWITECEIWDDSNPTHREEGLQRCEEVVRRCDELWLVGGRISPGMEREVNVATQAGLTVVNLIALGALPPWRDRCPCPLDPLGPAGRRIRPDCPVHGKDRHRHG